MKNRKREICTSGSVRDEAGQPPHLLGRRSFLQLEAGAVALQAGEHLNWAHLAWTQTYPARPVRIMVPVAAGGSLDILARLMGQRLSDKLGQTFIVENRLGGATNIGIEAVVRVVGRGQSGHVVGDQLRECVRHRRSH